MKDQTKSAIKLLEALTERAKELTCLYAIEELLKKPNTDIDDVCNGILEAIPPGWQYPEICLTKITIEDNLFQSPDFHETKWMQSADIIVEEKVVGSISVYYTEEMPIVDSGPFLKEEKKLIETIADRLGHYMIYKKMEHVVQEWHSASENFSDNRKKDWQAVLDLLRQTDNTLFLSISNKMLNHLCWSGIKEAENLRLSCNNNHTSETNGFDEESNRQYPSRILNFSTEFTEKIFRIAAEHLSGNEILSRIQMWIQEDRLTSLVQIVQRHLPLSEVTDALRRYFYTAPDEADARYPVSRGLKVSLIKRILSDRPEYINLLKKHVDIEDLYRLLQKVIFSPESHGKLGGKSAGFYLASQILNKAAADSDSLSNLRIPQTWFISSDMMLHFMHYNNIEEIIEQKYKEIDRVRMEYPHIIETFTNSVFPPEMLKGLSMILDEFGENPLIVRSSSVLEERIGSAFFGKYKSILIANQGTKQERLTQLKTAIAEIYASVFSVDPIEYRANRGILDFSEEMGIMIQEAVGARIGCYFLPAFCGTASCRNDFRWSEKIKPEDGVIRIVPGFGARLEGNSADDYPISFAPGQPGFKVNTTDQEAIRYAPKVIDVINLETNSFESINIKEFMAKFGNEYPNIEQVFSIIREGGIHHLEEQEYDFTKADFVTTFDGLISRSPFIVQMRTAMKTLEEKHGSPVEIQFASDGRNLYLLQCNPQNYSEDSEPSPIPKDVSLDKIVFTANRYISNGRIPDLTHIIYVDPEKYEAISDKATLHEISEAIGKLNKILPKRQFILIGPSKLGVRSNNTPGVNITYFDIENIALLVELIAKNGDAFSDHSLNTPFFQELLESNIRYLPLYPDDERTVFNEIFLKGAHNILHDMLPEYASLSDTLRLIDIPESKDGMVLQIMMNAELCEALGFLTEFSIQKGYPERKSRDNEGQQENYWRWRHGMAEHIAAELDPVRFGVSGFYLFGSTKNGTAGPGSDIDILVHFNGDENQREDLRLWLEGWSLCLDEMNYLQTGYRSKGLLDVHLVTDEDIEKKTSYAIKINAVTDAARPLKIKEL